MEIKNKTVVLHDDLKLECTVLSDLAAKIRWFKNDTMNDTELEVYKQIKDEGFWDFFKKAFQLVVVFIF